MHDMQRSWGKVLGACSTCQDKENVLINMDPKTINSRVMGCLLYKSIVYSKSIISFKWIKQRIEKCYQEIRKMQEVDVWVLLWRN